MIYSIRFWAAALVLLSGCAPSRVVRPLKKNEQTVSLAIGGPLIAYSNSTIPMPLATVSYARGLTSSTTAFGGLHLTSLAFGVLQLDAGACKQFYKNEKLGLGFTVNPAVNLAIDRWEKHFKLWPQLDFNFYKEIKPGKSFFYAGASNWFELSRKRADNQLQQRHWLFNPHLGFNYTVRHWNLVLESKYLIPYAANLPNVVEYKGINGKGSVGIYLGITRRFGNLKKGLK